MLPINYGIFKTYDIRGIYGQDFDNELAYLLGLAFVELRQNDPDYRPGQALRIAVGSDMRLSSPALKANLLRGLMAAGVEAVDLGLVATPTFYFAVAKYGYDGGIMISASHNPKEWNGFKLVRAKGVPISGETGISWLKEKIMANRFLPAKTPGQTTENGSALQDANDYALQAVDVKKIKSLKVVADAANSMGALYLEPLFAALNSELIKINFDLDGSFPSHEADPLKEENLALLRAAVLKHGADFGIATDGDGDRIFFVDSKGEIANPAVVRGVLAKIFLADRPGAKIGYDVRPGKITADLIKEGGGEPVLTRVGHSLIKEQMLKEDIYFAGESSGHFYLNAPLGCFEYPNIIILKLLADISGANQTTADYFQRHNRYFNSGEINRQTENAAAVFEAVAAKYVDGKISRLDGLSVEYPDFWFNLRSANTEPKIRLNLEAVSQEIMEKKRDEILDLIK